MRRSSQDRLLGGVGAGVADYLGTDVTATRVGLAAAAVLSQDLPHKDAQASKQTPASMPTLQK